MLDLKQVIPQPIVEFCCGRGFLLWPRIFAAVSRGIYESTPRNFSFFAAENSGPYILCSAEYTFGQPVH
jgi:hypothetical protein